MRILINSNTPTAHAAIRAKIANIISSSHDRSSLQAIYPVIAADKKNSPNDKAMTDIDLSLLKIGNNPSNPQTKNIGHANVTKSLTNPWRYTKKEIIAQPIKYNSRLWNFLFI